MVTENFGTLIDLYNRVLPALKSKVKELKQNHITFVTEKDVWDCLRKTKWNGESDLTLYDIVNDILFVDEKEVVNYLNYINKKQVENREEKRQEMRVEEDTIL